MEGNLYRLALSHVTWPGQPHQPSAILTRPGAVLQIAFRICAALGMEISWALPHLSYPREAFKAGPLSRRSVSKLGSPYFALTVFHHWIQILSGQWIPSGHNVKGFLRRAKRLHRSFDSISHNHEHWVGQISVQPLSNLLAQPNGGEISTNVHGIHQTGQGIYCQQCDSQFSTRALLECHAKETQHSPYRCRCGTTFSRLDVLHRHIQTFQPEVSYPCPHCKKHRGPRAFVRLDHLTQHLRGYHNMESEDESEVAHSQQSPRKRKATFSCPHETCSHSSGMASLPDEPAMHRTFLTRGEFTKHLREVHDESLFPCVEIGCCRIGGRGFFRKKDLLNHVKEHHTDAEFQPSAI